MTDCNWIRRLPEIDPAMTRELDAAAARVAAIREQLAAALDAYEAEAVRTTARIERLWTVDEITVARK